MVAERMNRTLTVLFLHIFVQCLLFSSHFHAEGNSAVWTTVKDWCNTGQQTCEHGGTCINTVTGFLCTCTPQFTGERCDAVNPSFTTATSKQTPGVPVSGGSTYPTQFPRNSTTQRTQHALNYFTSPTQLSRNNTMQPTRSTQTNTTQATRSSQTNTTQATRSSQTNTTQATRSSQTNTMQATRSSQTNTTQATRLFAQNYTKQPTLLPHNSLPFPTQSPQSNTTQLPTRSPAGSGSFPGQLYSGRSSGQTYAGHHSTTPSPKGSQDKSSEGCSVILCYIVIPIVSVLIFSIVAIVVSAIVYHKTMRKRREKAKVSPRARLAFV